jgi:hypothetical protein
VKRLAAPHRVRGKPATLQPRGAFAMLRLKTYVSAGIRADVRLPRAPGDCTMSILRRLFGHSSAAAQTDSAVVDSCDHKGYRIEARPFTADGQWQVAGIIVSHADGQRREHKFIRADRCTSPEEAAAIALAKGRLMIDQQGTALFT